MDLQEELNKVIAQAQEYIDKVESSDTEPTDEDVKALEGFNTKIAELEGKIATKAKSDALIAKIGGVKPGQRHPNTDDAAAKSLGDHFVKTVGEQVKAAHGVRGAVVAAPEYKAPSGTIATGGPGGPMGPVLTEVDKTIVGRYRRPTISDLLGTGTTSGDAIAYYVENGLEGDFEFIAEGAKAPQLSYVKPELKRDVFGKVAAFWRITEEMSDDLAYLVSEINGAVTYQLQLREEKALLFDDGTDEKLTGILSRSGIQLAESATVADNPDSIFRAATSVQEVTGFEADGLVIHPADYQALRLNKDGNGQYFGGGYFTGPYSSQAGIEWQPPVWGLRTIVTPAVPKGTAVVGAWTAASTLYRKGGVKVEMTNSHEADFTSFVVTLRAHERIALAVRRPNAFVKLTLK